MARFAVALTLGVMVGWPAAASAATHVADLEAIPVNTHVTDQYRAATGLHFVPGDPEFLPWIRDVGAQAHSGVKVGDIFNCAAEPPCAEGGSSRTRGRFDTTGSMVQVYVGFLAPGSPGTSVTLEAYNGGGGLLGSSSVTPGAGIKTPVTYTSATPNIASFIVSAPNSATASVAIDDITFTTPDTPPPPDFSLTADLGTVTLRQGTSVDVPITINRVNGSTGNITFAASGLPSGVTAEFIPNPATGTATTLRLTAAGDAAPPAAGDTFPEFTVTATPSASAGAAPRSFTKTIRIERNFTVEIAGGAAAVALPSCLDLEVPVLVRRGSTFTGSVDLTASFPAGNSAGIGASFEPATVGPGNGDAIMRLRVPASMTLDDRQIVVTGSSSGVPSASDSVNVDRVAQTVAATTGRGLTPRRGGGGTEITFTGGGFCPGSQVQFGNDGAKSSDRATFGADLVANATEISADGAQMKARVPRMGTTGKIRVIQPVGPVIESAAPFTVDSYRSRQGFAFDNFGWGNFSFGEMTDLYGIDEMFVHVNLCWPWGSCPVPTGVPDPLAYIAWQVIEQSLQASGGHCFGIAWTIQKLEAGNLSYNRFTSGATAPSELEDHTGPKNGLGSYLDSQHGGQTSAEFLDYYFDRSGSLASELATIQREFDKGRQPAISVKNGFTEGHVMTAYDIEAAPDGGAYIYVYDNNHPWVPRDTGPDGSEAGRNELKTVGTHHTWEIARGRIHIDAARQTWTFDDLGWSGGGGDLFAIPYGTIPGNPTLPLSLDPTTWLNLIIVFGASDGSAATAGVTGATESDFVPALDPNATPGSGTHIVRADGAVVHEIDGQKPGSYRDAFLVPGFAASLHNVRTGEGIEDGVSYDADARSMSFSGELDRALRARLGARTPGGDTHTAEVSTKAFEGGSDSFRFASRARQLVYRHDGPATDFRIALGRAGRKGMPVRFDSGRLRIRPGEKVTLKPLSWRRLDRVRLTITGPGGTRTRILRDQSRFAGGFAIRSLKVKQAKRKRSRLALRARFRRVPENATALAAFRVRAGRRTVARKAVALRRVRRGKRTLTAKVRLPNGRYRLTGYLTLTRPGPVPDSNTRSRTVRFRVSR